MKLCYLLNLGLEQEVSLPPEGTDCVPQNLTRNIYASEVIKLNTYPHRGNILVSIYENT
jgi:hypothetical protein